MIPPSFYRAKTEQEERRKFACADNLCEEKVRKSDHRGDNQENRERLICKINLC